MGMCYSEIHRILNPKSSKGGVKKISEANKLSGNEVIYRTTYSMKIPYRRFTKYFYLQESIKETYKAYAKEQEQLGLQILSESAMYKCLPKNVCSQKYIPFMKCLCVKCLNTVHTIEALRAAGVVVPQHVVMNILMSVCPFLVDKCAMSCTVHSNSVEDKKQTSPKNTRIQFCHVEQAEYTNNSLNVISRKKVIVTNNEPNEKKHDPNKLLLGYENAPEDLSSDIVNNNCNTARIFRECDTCGLHKVYEQILLQNPNIVSRYSEEVIWYLWGSYKEEINGKTITRPFNKYRHEGKLEELLEIFYNFMYNSSKHLFHYKWQAMQYEHFRMTIEAGEVRLVMDFGQNINHRKQFEAQSSLTEGSQPFFLLCASLNVICALR